MDDNGVIIMHGRIAEENHFEVRQLNKLTQLGLFESILINMLQNLSHVHILWPCVRGELSQV